MNKTLTYIGQAILLLQTGVLGWNVFAGITFIPVLTAGGFVFALLAIGVANLDRDEIALPSLVSMLIWVSIMANGVLA